MSTRATLAITGATGFVGSHLVEQAQAAGWAVRALTRRKAAEPTDTLTWVRGSLEDATTLRTLVRGADAVIHLAGVIKARTEKQFEDGNVGGTRSLIRVVGTDAAKARLIHVSSYAAREPSLSQYARSKAAAERLVRTSGLDWSIVRPPVVYGPRDRETLQLFKAATGLVMPIAGRRARTAMIYVEDLCQALLVAANTGCAANRVVELHDGEPAGISQDRLAKAIKTSVDGSALVLSLPKPLVWLAGAVSLGWGQLTRRDPMLTPGKVDEIYHPDWGAHEVSLDELCDWRPAMPLAEGLATTARWYRDAGWL